MKRTLRQRYGNVCGAGSKIGVLRRDVRVNSGPGGSQTTLSSGDRVEVGGPAANTAFLIAHRVQRLGEGWKGLGPFAVVPVDAVVFKRGRR